MGGTISINAGVDPDKKIAPNSGSRLVLEDTKPGGRLQAYGNMTARNNGKVIAYLGNGSVLTGALFDNSFVKEKNHYADDKGIIDLSGCNDATWIVSDYADRSIFSNDLGVRSSTLNRLTAVGGNGKSPFVVDLTTNGNNRALKIGKLQSKDNGVSQFNLRLTGSNEDIFVNDRVYIENVHGQHLLYVTVAEHGAEPAKELRSNWLTTVINEDKVPGETFRLANKNEKVDIGPYKYQLANDLWTSEIDGDELARYWYLVRTEEELSDPAETIVDFAGTQRFLHWADLQDLRKRLGEVRYGAQDGGWVRVMAQKDKADGTGGTSGLTQEYWGVSLGYDRLVDPSEERMWLIGGSFHYGKANQETRTSNIGTGETDRFGFNLYGTWAHSYGSYADLVLSGDWYEQEIKTHANDMLQKGSYDTWGVGLSIEVGHMFSSEAKDYAWGPWYRHLWIEPQVQLAYYYLKGTDSALSSKGIRTKYVDDDSLIGRVGVVIGSKWNYGPDYDSIDRRYVQLQLKGGVKHDFMGGYSLIMNDLQVTKDIGETTFYYGIGADWQLNDRTKLYLNLERESGSDYTKEYEASIGLKVNFD